MQFAYEVSMMHRFVLALCAVLLGSAVRADDWPQFRGPDRTGVSKEKGLLKAWPKDGLKPAWTFKNAGLGFSGVAVVKGVVYTLGTDKDLKNDIIIAIDEKTGSELWTAPLGPRGSFKGAYGDGPRSTPTIDGSHLYALGGYGDLVCVDISNKGKEVWRTHLKKNLGGEMMTEWGFSESPLVDGDLLICTPGGNDGTLAALDKKTGAVKWRSKEWTQSAPYSSAIAADIHGVRQYIQMGYLEGKGCTVAGIDAKSGKLLWSKPLFTGGSYGVVPTPVVQGNLVYTTSESGCQLFEINAKQEAAEKYKTTKLKKKVKNNHGGVVLIDGKIYGHTDPEAWICTDLKTGSDDDGFGWLERNEFKCASGAITAAEGLLYLYGDDGQVGLVQATSKEFALISKFTIPERSKIPPQKGGGKTWTHPVIANGVLYVRDMELIFAFKISAK
jgi:outer membrane protein assembly factor BamB